MTMNYLILLVVGLMLGSLGSVIIHRLYHNEKGLVMGRSKCPKCQKVLAPRDLIPVLSYIFNAGKCRNCKKKISKHYALLELCMAGMFLLTANLVGFENWINLTFHLFIVFIFVVVSFYDGLFKEIPDEIVLPTIVIAFIYQWAAGASTPSSLLLGFFVPVLFFGSLFFMSRGQWLGGGDIRIGGLMGAILGWPTVLMGLFLGYLLGATFSVVGLIGKIIHRKSQIPFAPFLLAGTYIAMFWNQEIMDWYLGLL